MLLNVLQCAGQRMIWPQMPIAPRLLMPIPPAPPTFQYVLWWFGPAHICPANLSHLCSNAVFSIDLVGPPCLMLQCCTSSVALLIPLILLFQKKKIQNTYHGLASYVYYLFLMFLVYCLSPTKNIFFFGYLIDWCILSA